MLRWLSFLKDNLAFFLRIELEILYLERSLIIERIEMLVF